MFASPADALVGLLDGKVDPAACRITGMSKEVTYAANGIKYFAVEVTSEAGAQYGISAYDEEAEELYKVTMERRARAVPMVIAAS